MTAITNAENLYQDKGLFSLIEEHILASVSIPNIVKEAKNLFPNFKQIMKRSLKL